MKIDYKVVVVMMISRCSFFLLKYRFVHHAQQMNSPHQNIDGDYRVVEQFPMSPFTGLTVWYSATRLGLSSRNNTRVESDGYRQIQNFTKIRLLHDN